MMANGGMANGGALALPPPMFPNLSRDYGFEPSAEEMEKAAEAARFKKTVKITGYHIKTFDLSLEPQAEAFSKLYMEIYAKAAGGEVVIHMMDRKFVENPSPRWLIHLEWSEYEMTKTDMAAPEQPKEDNNKKVMPWQ